MFASASPHRRQVVLKPEAKKGFSFKKEETEVNEISPTRSSSWARLLSRVFGIDVLKCECGSELKPVSAILLPSFIGPCQIEIDISKIFLPHI